MKLSEWNDSSPMHGRGMACYLDNNFDTEEPDNRSRQEECWRVLTVTLWSTHSL